MTCLSFSYHFMFVCLFFSFTQCVGAAQLVLGVLSDDLFPYVVIDLVCLWEQVEYRILLHHQLELKPPFGFICNVFE